MLDYPDTKLLIDGSWSDASTGKTIAVVNPATENVIGQVAHASRDDLDRALAAAERGFALWSAISAFERSKLMRKAADLLRARADKIAALMTLEQGKPLTQSKAETLGAADTIDWFAEEARRAYGRVIPARGAGITQLALKTPVGPVAAFTPWNFPINQVVRKLSAALSAGCSIIVKAPEETPASPAELIRAFLDAGLPAEVIGLVYGNPAEISEHLIAHPTIRKISFTGSTPVGKHLAALAGAHMKRATMELGGHAPAIVMEDANLGLAIPQLVMQKFRNAGQVCVSPTRFLVAKSVADTFIDGFVAAAGKIVVGDGSAPGVEMGPLANDRRVLALEAMIADAVDRGAKIARGGRRIGNKGYFFEPTVLTDVPTDAVIMNDEPFGPVAVINRYNSRDEIITEANRLPFGLASYAYTRSAAHQEALKSVRAGMMSVNHLGLGIPELPFGGIMDSGYGSEGGCEALEAYLDTRLFTTANSQ
ncbi:NAD-dependent succinate-semialdehyde dehydrogenase [Chelatococcus asaccharovorans]|uniref:NAD-dependent succinate-semialdehyde dehydrogenase n=1 Tax=Chelatococcus asaccharovorans TaxID=28210 RepID=UPI00224C6AE8|nr:NAD-dependent succinate-semialdehyde dehydrogenase [Chelatococcus asaccharovorans]CAH1655659.1 Alpha-ketoglutaric semialdehyde dehydrogenase 1 [Chelatococcus asaccharovorans]CAH1685351.1 Alpha-ketoglutaric semialdehyde dehydrogenase 1 [Chelatococcus asaccharovorans]